MTTYVLSGGCFWCLDAVFRRLRGLSSSVCGYTGGTEAEASYSHVSSGTTEHAESVEVTFNDATLPKQDLLDIFFLIHDPTTPNRQGADTGPQYRSAMFYANDAQKADFEAAASRASSRWDDPVVTTITPLTIFYLAEPEHQDYFYNNPANPYCSVVISPKVAKARQLYTKYFVD